MDVGASAAIIFSIVMVASSLHTCIHEYGKNELTCIGHANTMYKLKQQKTFLNHFESLNQKTIELHKSSFENSSSKFTYGSF